MNAPSKKPPRLISIDFLIVQFPYLNKRLHVCSTKKIKNKKDCTFEFLYLRYLRRSVCRLPCAARVKVSISCNFITRHSIRNLSEVILFQLHSQRPDIVHQLYKLLSSLQRSIKEKIMKPHCKLARFGKFV